tara:strand:- start:18850 stop:19635 length:786 start_codon:yes stop_codon:yes gene_type:complete
LSNYINKIFNLENKVAVVIGGGGHLCGEMAQSLAKAKCNVAILDINLKKAKKVKKSIDDLKYKIKTAAIEIDVTKKSSHIRAYKKVLKYFKHIDILINGAGINSPEPFFDITEKGWKSVIDSQVTGTFFACQIFGKYMVKRGKGSIINISSASANPPLSKAFAYSVSKSGIKNLTQNLAREWGTKGVRVNALRPGFFPTEWNKKNFITKQREKAIIKHTPMSRFGKPSELTGAVLWLSSDSSSFVTGSEIFVDGGFSAMTI